MYIPHLVCPFTCWWTPGVFSPFGYCKLHCHTNICLSKGFPFLWVYTQRWNSWVASQLVLVVKNLPANAGELGDVDFSPGSGRSHGEGHGNPLQYSCLENPMDRGAWQATVHRIAKSWTQLKQLSTHAHTQRNNGRVNKNISSPTSLLALKYNHTFSSLTIW